jgi:hypothetical protein
MLSITVGEPVDVGGGGGADCGFSAIFMIGDMFPPQETSARVARKKTVGNNADDQRCKDASEKKTCLIT